jgi:hypothetical protein
LQLVKNGQKVFTYLRDLWWIWAPGCHFVSKPEHQSISKKSVSSEKLREESMKSVLI